MGVLVEDGKGRGFSAEVDSSNRLRTFATVETEAHHVSEEDGELYATNATTQGRQCSVCYKTGHPRVYSDCWILL